MDITSIFLSHAGHANVRGWRRRNRVCFERTCAPLHGPQPPDPGQAQRETALWLARTPEMSKSNKAQPSASRKLRFGHGIADLNNRDFFGRLRTGLSQIWRFILLASESP